MKCHPWKENSCCTQSTTETAQKLKEGYGAEFHWDRCGPLSPECERFFVQEACFYECEPNAGHYRRFQETTSINGQPVYDAKCDAYSDTYDATDTVYHASNCDSDSPNGHNAWEMYQMPIKGAYCDAWYTACKNDLFCASASGDFFTCASEYKSYDFEAAQAVLQAEKSAVEEKLALSSSEATTARASLEDEQELTTAAIAGIIVAVAIGIGVSIGIYAHMSNRIAAKSGVCFAPWFWCSLSVTAFDF
jgi:hypothetical protein